MKVLGIITSLFLLPSISNAQIQRVWNIAEYTSIMLPPPTNGTKVAYRTLNNSLYYWDGTQWKRIAGPGIVDTSYSLSFSSPTLSLLGSGSSVSLTNLYTAGYGLIKTAETWRADTTSPSGLATRKYALTLPTSIANTRLAVSNGTNLVGYAGLTFNGSTAMTMGASGGSFTLTFPSTISGFGNSISTNYGSNQGDLILGGNNIRMTQNSIRLNTTGGANVSWEVNNGNHFISGGGLFLGGGSHALYPARVGILTTTPAYTLDINSTTAIKLPSGTDAQRPTGAFPILRGNTTGTGIEWHDGTRWAYALESTFARGTATRVPFFDANGQVTDHAQLTYVTGTPGKLIVPSGTASVNGIEFFGSDIGAGASGIRQSNNFIILYGNSGTRFVTGNGSIELVSQNGAYKINGRNVFQEATGTALDFGRGYRDLYFNPQSGATPRRINFYGVDNPANTKFLVESTGFVAVNGNTISSPRYQLDINSTDAIGLPRGTVAQRPTITTNTSPMRFNTDSTAFEYGESVGTWRQLATRPYARSLVAGLSPDTWLGTRLNAANVDINANGHELRIDSLSALIVSAESTSTLGGAGIEQIKWLNTSRTKYFNRRLHYDSRSAISGGMPAFYNLLTINMGAGDGFEWANEMIRDTTAGVFVYGYGGRYNEGYLKFGSIRSNTAGVYLSVPRFHFYGTNSAENATDNTYHTMWGTSSSISEMMMGLKDGGKFLIAADSTMIFDPSLDVPQFSKMGQGTKEAADLTKTQSNYIAGFATDGTVLDLKLGTGLAISGGELVATGGGSGGNSILDSLGNGSITIDADGNSLEFDDLDSLRFTTTGGNEISINDTEFTVLGLVKAKQEAYYEITSTSSPQTFSNTYSDNFVNQGGTQASFTFLFPATPADGQILCMTWNNAISVVTLDGNGNTLTGTAVTTAVAGTRRMFKFYAASSTWVKIY